MNAELLVLRGLLHVFTTVMLESLIGGGNWSTRSVRQDAWRFAALGQISFSGKCAKLNWMMAGGDEDKPALQLLDRLVFDAGIRKAEYVLADIGPLHPDFEDFRQAGFCPWGWGQIWQMDSGKLPESSEAAAWSTPAASDTIELLGLQRRLLPPAVQAVSRLADEHLPDFILRQDGRIVAYADSTVFGQKVMIRLTHEPCIPDLTQLVAGLFQRHFPLTPDRFILQRGDQVSLQEAMAGCASMVMPRFERMVKYLTVPLKVPVGAGAVVNNRHHADPVTPMLKTSGRQDNL